MRVAAFALVMLPAIGLTGCIVEEPRRPPPPPYDYDRRPPPPAYDYDRRPPPDYPGPPPRPY